MRVYLDHNATTPLIPEARAAMAAAMEVVGNPSSVHAEGRAAKGLMESARAAIAAALGADGADVIFTSGATEAAALVLAGRGLACAGVEHDAVAAWCDATLSCDALGRVAVPDPARATLQLANSETGVVQALPAGLWASDLTQAFGKIPFAFNWLNITAGFVSAHKLGGPKGIGALILRPGTDLAAQLKGGGQEMGRRAGTENLIGIAGFAAAATRAMERLAAGGWQRVAELRMILENGLAEAERNAMFPGRAEAGPPRLPNTTCVVTPGWRGETQVMAMDLAGFAVSAGAACSSGKVRASRVLGAMGYDETLAGSALRVSLGIETTRAEVDAFLRAWGKASARHRARHG